MPECRLFASMFKLIWIQKLQFCFDHNHSVTNCVQKWENAKFVLKHAKNDFLCIIKYYFNVFKFVLSSFLCFLKNGSFCLICNGKKWRTETGFEPSTCSVVERRISHYTTEVVFKNTFNFYCHICVILSPKFKKAWTFFRFIRFSWSWS